MCFAIVLISRSASQIRRGSTLTILLDFSQM
jgi:hypothetical protein